MAVVLAYRARAALLPFCRRSRQLPPPETTCHINRNDTRSTGARTYHMSTASVRPQALLGNHMSTASVRPQALLGNLDGLLYLASGHEWSRPSPDPAGAAFPAPASRRSPASRSRAEVESCCQSGPALRRGRRSRDPAAVIVPKTASFGALHGALFRRSSEPWCLLWCYTACWDLPGFAAICNESAQNAVKSGRLPG